MMSQPIVANTIEVPYLAGTDSLSLTKSVIGGCTVSISKPAHTNIFRSAVISQRQM
ncbi:MAG TPA: hypothetical protein VM260_27360 [Pirellula sp.]|nr:hypothetical protein [Pirellula sp.]